MAYKIEKGFYRRKTDFKCHNHTMGSHLEHVEKSDKDYRFFKIIEQKIHNGSSKLDGLQNRVLQHGRNSTREYSC